MSRRKSTFKNIMALDGSRIRSEILGQALKLVVEKLLGPLCTHITINEVVKLMGVLNFGLDREMDLFSIFPKFVCTSDPYPSSFPSR